MQSMLGEFRLELCTILLVAGQFAVHQSVLGLSPSVLDW